MNKYLGWFFSFLIVLFYSHFSFAQIIVSSSSSSSQSTTELLSEILSPLSSSSFLYPENNVEMCTQDFSQNENAIRTFYKKARSILFLGSGTDEEPLKIAQLQKKTEVVITDLCIEKIPFDSLLTNYHILKMDNSKTFPFSSDHFDVIVMNQGICACQGITDKNAIWEIYLLSFLVKNPEKVKELSDVTKISDWLKEEVGKDSENKYSIQQIVPLFKIGSSWHSKVKSYIENPEILYAPSQQQYKLINSFQDAKKWLPLPTSSCGGISTKVDEAVEFFKEVARVLNKKNPQAKAFLRGQGEQRLYQRWQQALQQAQQEYSEFRYEIMSDQDGQGIMIFPAQ